MSAKRRDRAAPPPGPGEWDVRFGTTEAAKGWEVLCQHAAGPTLDAWKLMRASPRPPVDSRHKQLRGDLAKKVIDGRSCEQWQIEVTGGGRIWYAIDDVKHVVWIMYASAAHPKATE